MRPDVDGGRTACQRSGMCGRFTQLYSWQDLVAAYRILDQAPLNLEPRYNIAPTQQIDIVLPEGAGHRVARARWGLVPMWWKKELRELPSTINARAETVAEKPMFRSAYKARRCIIPASGFYEWTGPKSARLPWYISAADGKPMSFAGLWEKFRDPGTGEEALSATIIVCPANGFMGSIHDRIPVILNPADVDAWMAESGADLMRPCPEGQLEAWRVSPNVNSNRYHEADAVEPVDG